MNTILSGQPYQVIKIFPFQTQRTLSTCFTIWPKMLSEKSVQIFLPPSSLTSQKVDHHHSSSDSQDNRPVANASWVCGAPALPDTLACHSCVEEATKEKESDVREVTDIIRESVRASIQQVSMLDMDRAVQCRESNF